ncbi:hypothetical protein OCOL_001625 [Ordospora colligata]|uniref:TPR repeat-containing protein n=1 Tax=Ordospora colligata OC4 TaxID=1354746 RepID=A0A0B2UJC3_9MICR|nr:uncharacterized protein M896_080430 [Ordospora colligata OC4]KHN69309.1 hypothetical protein M896_080430 [Ordospora colligata OC4]TBU15125.1 hypothetical protein CWI41_080440 [Ordospora colligata]TBU15176.1 hypothetical protein CWI40_080440 [Ordospora colligata]
MGPGMIDEAEESETDDDLEEALLLLSCYIRKIEDVRVDSRRFVFADPRIYHDSTLRYLTERQTMLIQVIIDRYMDKTAIAHLNHATQSEVHLYMGFCYEKGLFGANMCHATAFNHYILSAQLNNPMGTFRVARCYEKGIGKQKNTKKALYFYRCAAKLGHVDSMHIYGATILFGNNICSRKMEAGYFYLSLAAKKASSFYPYALYDFARCYEEGSKIDILPKDPEYAFKNYMKGACLDCPNCQFRVGLCFENGELGQERDVLRAVEWYFKAADLGQSDAQLRISALFLNGYKDVLDKNHELAFRFGIRAAIQEHVVAAYLVSDYYIQGIGIKKSRVLSSWWSLIAEELRANQNIGLPERIKVVVIDNEIDHADFEDGMIGGLIRAQ